MHHFLTRVRITSPSSRNTASAPKTQRGFLLLEVLAGLFIFAAVITGVTVMINKNSEDTRIAVAAQHLRTVGDAAAAYIRSNYVNIRTITNNSSTPIALITVGELITAGNLPAGFAATNNYQQNTCVLVKNDDQVQHPGQVIALAVTEDGTAMDDVVANSIANLVGASGGAYRNNNSGLLQGSRNGWQIQVNDFQNLGNKTSTLDPATRPPINNAKCNGTSGGPVNLTVHHPVMALWLANGGINPDVLYRQAIPGRPDLNEMQTPLGLATAVEGGVCVTNIAGGAIKAGAIASTQDGALLSCINNKWSKPLAKNNIVLRGSSTTGLRFQSRYAICDIDKGETLVSGSCTQYCFGFSPGNGSPFTKNNIAIGWTCIDSPLVDPNTGIPQCTSAPRAYATCQVSSNNTPISGAGTKTSPGIIVVTDLPACIPGGTGPCKYCDANGENCNFCTHGVNQSGNSCNP